MDDPATTFCRYELAKLGNPLDVRIEDLVKEYRKALEAGGDAEGSVLFYLDNTVEELRKKFCIYELSKRGNPPNIELEDITQEYHLALAMGKNPESHVMRHLDEIAKKARKTFVTDRMDKCPVEMTLENDEEYGERLERERQAYDKVKAELWVEVEAAMKKSDGPDYCPKELTAIKLYYDLFNTPNRTLEVAKQMKVTRGQAQYLIDAGKARIRGFAEPIDRKLPLYKEIDKVPNVKKVYRRRDGGRYRWTGGDLWD